MPSAKVDTSEVCQDRPSLVIDREGRKSGSKVEEGAAGLDIANRVQT